MPSTISILRSSSPDGIAIENVGDIPFAVIKDLADEIVLVSEDEVSLGSVFLVCISSRFTL